MMVIGVHAESTFLAGSRSGQTPFSGRGPADLAFSSIHGAALERGIYRTVVYLPSSGPHWRPADGNRTAQVSGREGNASCCWLVCGSWQERSIGCEAVFFSSSPGTATE
jgi:hypothetical protein